MLRFQCARQESNLRPCAPEAHALSPELRAGSQESTGRRHTHPTWRRFVDSSRGGCGPHRDTHARADIRDLARVHGCGRRRSGLAHPRRGHRTRRGSAGRAVRRVGGVRARLHRGARGSRRGATRSRWRRWAPGWPRFRARKPRSRRSTPRCTTCRESCSAFLPGACSGFRARARRPRGRSGSATPTTWLAARSRRRRGFGGSS